MKLPKDIDKEILPLVKVLNSFPGVTTIGSCAGHKGLKKQEGGRWPEGSFYVKMLIDWTKEGYFSLEWLSWYIFCVIKRGGSEIFFNPFAPPPYLNTPGEMLSFVIEGYNIDLVDLAERIKNNKDEYFYTPEEMEEKTRQLYK